ncbi:MAG TPA: FAD-dependent oxidoreductase [Burkholderiaceae bacterium]|nr:FAD-dependent oxidoreductase [Burkholderiaceae bacterium]
MSSAPPSSALDPRSSPFPNFTELPRLLPGWAWNLLRLGAVAASLALAAFLVLDPDHALPLFWGLIVPVLPLVFMFTPGLWRNLCPLATSNQLPRRLGISQGLTQRALSQGLAYPIGIALLIAGVVGRKLLFNFNGAATAELILAAMGSALLGGLLFKGKSGWCSSICPLLPVQRLYGQTPFIRIANTQCEPCVGCAKNCYDFNPGQAYLADQYDPNPNYRNFRRFFAGIFPGLILGYYLVPDLRQVGAAEVLLQMTAYLGGSLSVFTLLDLLLGAPRNVLPVISAALAINLYYWFAAPLAAQQLQRLGVHPDLTLVGGLRTAVTIGSLIWVARSCRIERLFLSEQVQRSGAGEISLAPVVVETVRLNRKMIPIGPASGSQRATVEAARPALPAQTAAPATAPAPAATSGHAELRVEPDGLCTALRSGRTLLDLLEGCGADVHPGCRAGVCGADAIAVTAGADCLGPVGDTERATLARLGHAPNTRLACMARVRHKGAVHVELKPHAAGATPPAAPPTARPNPATLHTQPAELNEAQAAASRVPARLPTLTDRIRPQPQSEGPANDDADRLAAIRRVVIVGNGVAGLSAAEELRRHHRSCEIDLIAREDQPAYNRMALSELIHRASGMAGLYLKPEAWYAEQRIRPWLNTRAAALDTRRRRLTVATGEVLAYDRLILATGAQAWVPPVAGWGLGGCFVLRSAADATGLRAHVQQHGCRRAVVAGAGLLGLEAAAALRALGLSTRVLSLNDRVLDRQIDATASRLVVEHLRRQGIELVTQAALARVEPDAAGRLQRLHLADGRRLDAELLLICAGTRPDLDLARSAGLTCGRGVVVDRRMRSSAAQVYAAGDVAECDGALPGLWGVAAEQGRIAALSALGLPGEYQPIQPSTALKLAGIQVRAAGLPEAREAGQTELRLRPAEVEDAEPPDQKAPPAYAKLVVEAQRVIGAVVVGDDPQVDALLQAAGQRQPLASLDAELTQRIVASMRRAPSPSRRAA